MGYYPCTVFHCSRVAVLCCSIGFRHLCNGSWLNYGANLMHLHFKWSDSKGETTITHRSLELLQERFGDGCGIDVLDFLSDVLFIVTKDYEDALAAFNNRYGKIDLPVK